MWEKNGCFLKENTHVLSGNITAFIRSRSNGEDVTLNMNQGRCRNTTYTLKDTIHKLLLRESSQRRDWTKLYQSCYCIDYWKRDFIREELNWALSRPDRQTGGKKKRWAAWIQFYPQIKCLFVCLFVRSGGDASGADCRGGTAGRSELTLQKTHLTWCICLVSSQNSFFSVQICSWSILK